uniref:Uncharacterized protein n=1 Tax=Arundo donax TaxID=35708 RepID=A0A0A9AJM2_ARUDO
MANEIWIAISGSMRPNLTEHIVLYFIGLVIRVQLLFSRL